MRLGAYQFPGGGNLERNFAHVLGGIKRAAEENDRFLAFHECALTGYPPLETTVDSIDFEAASRCLEEVRALSVRHGMYIALGTAERRGKNIYNTVRVFAPDAEPYVPYDKRALWGWDRENFYPGGGGGLFEADGVRIGVRICFEVRFPEYFRELYQAGAGLCVVSFCDLSREDDRERYCLIRAHLQTRAVENVMPILAVNSCARYQTAPTAFFDRSGRVTAELERGREDLLIYDFIHQEENFGTRGRRTINELLLGGR